MHAVRKVDRGESYLSPLIAKETIEFLLNKGEHYTEEKKITARQREILELLAVGMSMKQVANKIDVKPRHHSLSQVSNDANVESRHHRRTSGIRTKTSDGSGVGPKVEPISPPEAAKFYAAAFPITSAKADR